jgi:phage terminase large subunit-like protein
MMDRVTEYARRVVDGDVVCGELHRLACERHLRDLARQDTDDFPYYWDPDAARRVINYAEKLTVIEGFKRRPVKLMDCQAFDVGCTFGWYNRRGFRRFRRRYKSVARQQGKSFENGILGTYIAGFSGYNYGQLYTAATKKRQAKIAWSEMQKFIEADADLQQWFEVKEYKNTITALNTHCVIECLSKESGLDDGFRPLMASIDELHQMKDNSVFKALYNGTRDLDETLISMITTRGFNVDSFAYEMDSYAINVLRGVVTAEDFFADIYALDEGDDIWDERNWIKSNPRLASTEHGMERLRTDAATAKAMGGAELRDFITKSLNMWVTKTDDTFVAPEDWKKAKTTLALDDFRGERCWVGVDLSSGGDLTSIAIEFEHGSKDGAYIYSHSFMPRGRMSEHCQTDVAPYDLWHEQGLITTMGGETDFRTDYKFVVKHLRELVEEYDLDIQAIGYDPHNADAFTADLEEFGAPLIKVVQSAKSLNDATVDIQLLVKSGDFAYDKRNELMAWSFINAQLVRNSFDEVKIDKKPGKSRRIDPVDACVDAHFARLVQRDSTTVDVDEEMARYLEMMGWN